MIPGDASRIARICAGTLIAAGLAVGISVPVAAAAPDCSPAGVDSAVAAITKQAQNYLNSNPAGNKALMTAALQPRPQAEATLQAYAASNPAQYAEFKAILAPLGTLQSQCGVEVVPAQYQWAFDQFIGS